jgi:hypothetical protein
MEATPSGRMTPVIEIADDSEMRKRALLADEFYEAIGLLEDETWPFFVSDEAALYDFQMEPDDEVVRLVKGHYGVTIRSPEDFRRPFWQLLDDLHGRRS